MTKPHSPTIKERVAAEYLGLSVRTLQKRRFERQNPPYLKIGRSVRYRLEDLDAFLEAHRIDPRQGAVNE
jgi:excisionase family DNA binding protein